CLSGFTEHLPRCEVFVSSCDGHAKAPRLRIPYSPLKDRWFLCRCTRWRSEERSLFRAALVLVSSRPSSGEGNAWRVPGRHFCGSGISNWRTVPAVRYELAV